MMAYEFMIVVNCGWNEFFIHPSDGWVDLMADGWIFHHSPKSRAMTADVGKRSRGCRVWFLQILERGPCTSHDLSHFQKKNGPFSFYFYT